MNEWHFFTYLFGQIHAPFDAAVQGIINGLVGYLTAPLLLIVSVYLAGMTAVELYRPDGNLGMNTIRRLFRAALVVAVVSNAAIYNQYVATFLFHTLPTELTNAVSGGAVPINSDAFDQLWGSAWGSATEIYKATPRWSIKGVFIMLIDAGYVVIAAASVLVAFLIFVSTHVLLALLIATGPAFVVLFLFPRTTRFFDGWIAGVASLILTQVFIVTLLAFMIGIETAVAHRVAATASTPVDKQDMNVLLLVVEGGIVYAMGALMAVQIPGIARGVAGGVAHSVAPYTGLVQGAVTGAGQQVAQGAKAATATTSTIRRNLVPPGRAL